MKKVLFLFVATAMVMTACNKTVTVEENRGDAISFRPLMTNMTKAADVDLETNGFYVTALKKDQTPSAANTYFDNVAFTYNTGTYTSAAKYYWPSAYNLDFYAYSPAASGDISRTDYKTFVVTANATAASQVDFVYASTKDWGKITDPTGKDGKSGVTINFRHAESKVVIMLKNTNPNLVFTVGDVTIGNLYNKGTFTYTVANDTDGKDSGNLLYAEWGSRLSGSADAYTSTFAQTVADGTAYSTTTPAQAGVDLIMIPQTLNNATAYASASSGAAFSGAYIKVQLKIQNQDNDAYIVGAAESWQEAIWPLAATEWDPGYKYTYTVDLAGGGYFPTNQDSNSDLDPILEGAEIKFTTVTVDGWDDASPIAVTGGV